MRVLTNEETILVSGGVGPLGGTIGFAIGFGGTLLNGGSTRSAITSGILGGLSGAAGNMAGAAAAGGLMKAVWGTRALGLGVSSSLVPQDLGPKSADEED